jgi:hypothetical protein
VGGPFPPESNSSRLGFGADLASAARALVSQPSVPLVSLVATLLPVDLWRPTHPSVVSMLTMQIINAASLFFLLGWYGAERVFFQRHLEGKPVTLRHLLRLVKAFMGRFVVLGLPFGIVLMIFFGVAFSIVFADAFREHRPRDIQMPAWLPIGGGVLVVGMDFALTFVTPALAYTTRSARRALTIGFAMMRQTWPRCALYVLCPPLALNVLNFTYSSGNLSMRFILTAFLVLVGLLAKGAIAAFYLRERGSYSEDGAAYIGNEVGGEASSSATIHEGSRFRATILNTTTDGFLGDRVRLRGTPE